MEEESTSDNEKPFMDSNEKSNQEKIRNIEQFADLLISTSPDDIKCKKHINSEKSSECNECKDLVEKVNKYQSHNHTFTCAKKKKTITIKETEGHGRLDGFVKGVELKNIPVCTPL